jgi:hypothetical protein
VAGDGGTVDRTIVWPVQYSLFIEPKEYGYVRWPREFYLRDASAKGDGVESPETDAPTGAAPEKANS